MKKYHSEYFSVESTAFFLSLFVHLIIARLFIFSFPLNDVAHKPVFVFWGSFLDPIESNLTEPGGVRPSELGSAQPMTGPFLYTVKGTANKPNADYQNESTQTQKISPKKTFLTESPLQRKAESISTDPRLDATRATYRPLRLNSKFVP